jgi:hypothetical protein
MDANSHRLNPPPSFLNDVTELHDRIQRLRALLDLQRRQMGGLEARLYQPGPAGVAAKRLVALKSSARA